MRKQTPEWDVYNALGADAADYGVDIQGAPARPSDVQREARKRLSAMGETPRQRLQRQQAEKAWNDAVGGEAARYGVDVAPTGLDQMSAVLRGYNGATPTPTPGPRMVGGRPQVANPATVRGPGQDQLEAAKGYFDRNLDFAKPGFGVVNPLGVFDEIAPAKSPLDFTARVLPRSALRMVASLPTMNVNLPMQAAQAAGQVQANAKKVRGFVQKSDEALAAGDVPGAIFYRKLADDTNAESTRAMVGQAAAALGLKVGGAPGMGLFAGGEPLGQLVTNGPEAAWNAAKHLALTDPAAIAAPLIHGVPKAIAAVEGLRTPPFSPQDAAHAAAFGAGIDPQGGFGPWAQRMEQQFGRGVRKSLPEIWQTSEAIRGLGGRYEDLFSAVPDMAHWRDWYDRHLATLTEQFGADAPQVLRFLAATSQAASVPSNVGLGIKAYGQWLGGQPFEGYLPAVKANLGRAAAGEELRGLKISNFDRATRGDASGVAVDRHLSRLFWGKDSPSSPAEYEAGVRVVENMGARLGWEPREVQSALWALNQVRQGVPESKIGAYDTQLLTPRNQQRLADIRARFGNLAATDGAGGGRGADATGAAAGPVGADAAGGAAGASGRVAAGPSGGDRPAWDVFGSLKPARIAQAAQDLALAPLGLFLGAGGPGGFGRGGLFDENAAGAGGHSPDGGAGLPGGAGASPRGGDRGTQLPAGPAGATRIEHIAPEDLGILPGIQYKRGVNKEGVTDILSNQREYQVEFGDTLTAFRNADGKLYVVDGHHRRELARRSGRFTAPTAGGGRVDVERTLPVRVLDARDGWTEADARAYGVLKNLRENKGVAIDAADALRAVLDEGQARGEASNLPKTPLARDVAGLVLLDEPGRAMVRAGGVRPAVAAGIGETLRGDQTRQRVALEEAAKSPGLQSYEDGLTLGRQVRDEAVHDVGDGGQGDLFGGDAGGTTFVSTAGKQTELLRSVRLQLAGEKSGLLRPVGTDLLEGEAINAGARQEMAGRIKDAGDKFGAVTEYDPAVRQLVRDVAAQALRGEISDVEAQKQIRAAVIKAGEGATLAQIVARSSSARPTVPETLQPKPTSSATIPTAPMAAPPASRPAPRIDPTPPPPPPPITVAQREPPTPTPTPAAQSAGQDALLGGFSAAERTRATLEAARAARTKQGAPPPSQPSQPSQSWPTSAAPAPRDRSGLPGTIMQQLKARGSVNQTPQTSGAPPDLSTISGKPDRMTDPVTGQGAMDLGPMTNVRTGLVESLPPPNAPGGLREGLAKLGQAADASRSLVASGDFSGLGNQGGVIVATHPILSARAAGAMLRGTFSEAKAKAITDEIDGRQMGRYGDPDFYARVGLDRTNYLARTPGKREEAFPVSPVENIPGIGGVVKASDRAYSIVLDRQRADTFDTLYDGVRSVGWLFGDDRPVSEAEAQAIARYVNIATGRGHFGEGKLSQELKDAMPALARVLFAPRYQLSRVQHLTGVPLWGQMSPRARAVIAGEYAKYVAAQAAFIGAAQASGQADVDTDPRSTNFLKVKLKNAPLELDPLGSARGYLVLAARLGSPLVDRARGEDPGPNFISEAGDESSKTAVDLVGGFVGNKAAPLPRAVASSLGVGSGARAFQLGPGRGDDGEFRSGEALGLVTAISPRQLVEDIINADGDPQKIQAATASYLLNTLGFQSKVQKDWSGGGDAALAKILAESFK